MNQMVKKNKPRPEPNLTLRELLKYYKTYAAAARAINVTPPALHQWGFIIPKGRAYEYEVITNGKLKAYDPGRDTRPPKTNKYT